MMRMYCLKQDKDWDEGVHLLLFAICESVHEGLGFELVLVMHLMNLSVVEAGLVRHRILLPK